MTISQSIFNTSLNLTDLGIGGLTEQFSEIFRRAFASRLLSDQVAEKLGVTHTRGIVLYGPPGCGKTLLIRIIAGRPLDHTQFEVTGMITLNEGKYHRSGEWHRKVAFIQRNDKLYPRLTVRESVLFAARLKIRIQMGENVEEIIRRDSGGDGIYHRIGAGRSARRIIGHGKIRPEIDHARFHRGAARAQGNIAAP